MAPEEILEILLEPDEIEERPVIVHLDQQIDVAVGPVVACFRVPIRRKSGQIAPRCTPSPARTHAPCRRCRGALHAVAR